METSRFLHASFFISSLTSLISLSWEYAMISFCSKLLNSIPVCLKSRLAGVLHVKTITAGDGFLDTVFLSLRKHGVSRAGGFFRSSVSLNSLLRRLAGLFFTSLQPALLIQSFLTHWLKYHTFPISSSREVLFSKFLLSNCQETTLWMNFHFNNKEIFN